MRSWVTLAALAMIVAGLGFWVYYKPAPAPTETYALSQLKAGDVRRLRIERPALPEPAPAQTSTPQQPAAANAIALEKSDGAWRMTAPVASRVDPFQLDRLLSLVEARSSVRYSNPEPVRYGFDHPGAVLTLEDQTFTFGQINATTGEQYVMTGDHVFLVPLGYGAALPRSADALLSRSLFAPNEAPTRFDLPGFTVALEDGTWAVAPALPDVSADERNAWVDSWRRASAIGAARHAVGEAQEHIKVQLKDERTITLGILRREPELVLLREDEGIEYRFVPEVARRMLAAPGASHAERVNK